MQDSSRWFLGTAILLGIATGCDSSNTGTSGKNNGTNLGVCSAEVASGSPALIDDLNDGDGLAPNNDGRHGGWYTYSDSTALLTPPPVPANGCNPSYVFLPTNGQACMSGSGFTNWGAGIGVSLNAGGKDCQSCQYDATAYNGVRFTISGTVTGSVRFQVVTKECHGALWGGSCPDPSVCGDCYGLPVAVTPDPKVIEVAWADLKQVGWGPQLPWNVSDLHELNWAVNLNGSTPASFQDLCVDDVSFY
jgi:hypothetical protein